MLSQRYYFIFREKDGDKITPGLIPFDFSETPNFSYGLILVLMYDI